MQQKTEKPLLIAQDGRPFFEIRLPRSAAPAEEFAAEELGRALYAMIGPGARMKAVTEPGSPKIYVNEREAALCAGIHQDDLALGAEMFHLETRGGNLYILGGGPRGVLYGVYELLDSLGCRWYTPELSHIPLSPTIELPAMRKTGGPAFENRDTFNSETRDPLWRARNRMNGWSTPTPEFMGGNVDYCGFVHTFYSLLPPGEFFDAHPEYYSLVAGQRRRDLAQLCLTNPDVLRIVTARVLDLMETHPRATIFSVSQNDCYGYCECPACSAAAEAEGSQSGPLIRFVNAVAEGTSRRFPDKLLDTLAYQYTLDAPRIAKPHPNVRVRLCSINCCQGHTYGTCDHPESVRFHRALRDWSGITSQMYIWHYATDFTHYPLPMPDFDELHGNINLYRKSGVRGLFIQGMGEPGGGAESMALRGYVVSRLLWNPDQPVWPIVDEFLAAYYGAAAKSVRRYLDIFHGAVRAEKSLHPSLYDLPSSRLYDDDLRLPADEALAEAETRVTGGDLRRVQLLRGGLRYARLFRAAGSFHRNGDTYAGSASPADAGEFEELARMWQAEGIQRIREAEDFDFTVQKHRARLSAHRVDTLADGNQRVAVVPGLGGRLIEWEANGIQWLAPADADSMWSLHPFSGGYSESTVLGMYVSRGWGEAYASAWNGDRLTLTARVGSQLKFSRELWIENGALRIDSQLENTSEHPARAGWGANLNLLLPASARVVLQSPAGEQAFAWEQLAPGELVSLTGEKAPQESWEILTNEGRLRTEYQGHPLARFSLLRQENPARLALEWRTASMEIKPGESVRASQRMLFSPR